MKATSENHRSSPLPIRNWKCFTVLEDSSYRICPSTEIHFPSDWPIMWRCHTTVWNEPKRHPV